jgi:Undecaprenyl-phosphate galactose phosphotransferase WbaP
VAVLAMPGAGRERLVQLLETLPFPQVVLVPDLFGLQSLWVSSRDLGGVLALEVKKNLLLRRSWVLKRALDYALGVPLFLLSLPLIGLFALWVKAVSPGPAFYVQEREGYRGRTIRVWKLRTMYPDAEARLARYLEENLEAREEWERYFKLKRDPRVLPGVGHFLRQTSLDELPQLWNVLRGEMSLVGPRPFPRYHLEKFSPAFRRLRQSVLPGLTGLWQVSARSEGDLEVQEALDTYYIRNWSLWLDLYILARTAWVILTRKGAY